MDIREQMFKEMLDKQLFRQVQEYAFDYADESNNRNVFPSSEAIENLKVFDEELPNESGNSHEILKQLHTFGSPASISQIGGRYFGLVNGGVIPTALAAKWLTDFWDQNAALYVSSPITSTLETVVEAWMKQLLQLPENTVAGFVSGSSVAILCGLAAARFRIYQKLNWDINTQGLWNAPKIRLVVGKHAHGTVLKAITLLGFGTDNIEWVDVDAEGRMLIGAVPELDEQTILILQAGNVNSGSFDFFEEIGRKANAAKCWIHIDGAFGLWAAASGRLNHLTHGIERANSWSVDGHKTLNTPYDCGVVMCNDQEALLSALRAPGSYIAYSDKRDGMLYTPEMSRRARAVELWASLKYLGKQGIDDLVTGLHEKALLFSEALSKRGFTILNEVVFNQVLVACADDRETEETLVNLQAQRVCWCGGSQWFGKKVIRISVCSWATTTEDIHLSVQSFVDARSRVKH